MVSDSDLIARLRQILPCCDLNTETAASIRGQLEEEFGVSLYDRKTFITQQIRLILQAPLSQPQNDDAERPRGLEDKQEEEEKEKEEKEKEEDDDNDDSNNGNEEKEDENENEEREDNDEVESEVDEDEQEEEETDEDGSKNKRTGKKDENVKRKPSGLCKPCALSPPLQKLVGAPELARTEVVKRIWEYIREKNLQNPNNKKRIICDETMREVFQVDTMDMFKMNKLLSKHIWPIETEDAIPVKSSSKAKQKKQDRQEVVDEPKQKGKRKKGQASGFLAPLQLSDALVKFLGTGESELSRAKVVQRIWQYIRENKLQDPTDKKRVICDDKLKELFNLDSFFGFTMTTHLTSHFIKKD